jgi:hypothetical protein
VLASYINIPLSTIYDNIKNWKKKPLPPSMLVVMVLPKKITGNASKALGQYIRRDTTERELWSSSENVTPCNGCQLLNGLGYKRSLPIALY